MSVAKRMIMKRTVHTIGYEGADIASFVETLKRYGVTLLADVRAIPLSRKRGFSKKGLAQRLNSEGIEYRHFRQLGDPKPGRLAARAGRYDEFRRIYGDHLSLGATREALSELTTAVRDNLVCLMCFERDPATCHRTLIAQTLEKQGIITQNLFCDVRPIDANSTPSVPRRYLGQGASAAQQDIR